MAIKTGKVGKLYTIRDSTAFTTEATTEDGTTKIYQIDDVDMRVWDINTTVVISTGAFDKSYYDNGVNYFEGKVKLLTSGEVGLTVTGASLTLNEVAKCFGWALNMTLETGEDTSLGEEWKSFVTLGKSGGVNISRYRYDERFNLSENGYQESGLEDKTLKTDTGILESNTYYFEINIDGAGASEESITTLANSTGYNASDYDNVIDLLNAEVTGDALFEIVNGDLRCTSTSVGTGSSIALANGDGTSGDPLFNDVTGWTAFQTAVVGSLNTNMFLLKLYEDATYGYICNAIRTGLANTKAVGALDQEATTFQVTSQIGRF